MSEKSLFLELVGDLPLFKIIDFLMENKGMDYTKTEISKGANVSRTSLFNYWNDIEKFEVVKVTRQIGKAKLYTINSKSQITKRLFDLENVLIAEALRKDAEMKNHHDHQIHTHQKGPMKIPA